MEKEYKRVLSIAGSDSGGGAGIQADLKTLSACGCYGMTAITSLTVQNTCGVRGVHSVPTEVVAEQIEAVLEDIGADAVKTGMLPTADIIQTVATMMRRFQVEQLVVDPVMVATSGDRLISTEAADAFRQTLFPLSRLVTPNLPEAEYLTGIKIGSDADFPAVAESLIAMGARAVLVKAGHLDDVVLTDYLFDGERSWSYSYPRIDTANTHGTGCTLSSAIAAFLAQGHPLHEAVGRAEEYLHRAIVEGRKYRIGHGHGPVHHFWPFWL